MFVKDNNITDYLAEFSGGGGAMAKQFITNIGHQQPLKLGEEVIVLVFPRSVMKMVSERKLNTYLAVNLSGS